MCGRYASFREAQDLADAFAVPAEAVAEDARRLPPSWNLAPTDPVRVVVERAEEDEQRHRSPEDAGDARGDGRADDRGEGAAREGGVAQDPGATVRSLRLVRWGLVPGWAKDPSVGSRMINARVESLADKPAFRTAVATRRCLVPAEGYYEWMKPPAGSPAKTPKQPFWIHPDDGGPLAFAGLYAFWRDRSRPDDDPDRWLVTMTIVTGGAATDDPALAEIHDRRPIVLQPSLWDAWLDPHRREPEDAVRLLHQPSPRLVATPVSTAVNRVGTDGPELIEPVDLPPGRGGAVDMEPLPIEPA